VACEYRSRVIGRLNPSWAAQRRRSQARAERVVNDVLMQGERFVTHLYAVVSTSALGIDRGAYIGLTDQRVLIFELATFTMELRVHRMFRAEVAKFAASLGGIPIRS
jgi:hypothetical protein